MISTEELNRMRWASRRGMLELDLVLGPFVEARYQQLSSQQRDSYRKLLACEDQDLFAWFLHRQRPDDQELAAIVDTVLEFARTEGGTA